MLKPMDEFWTDQQKWSEEVFGPTELRGPVGPAKHLAREVLHEVLDMPKAVARYLTDSLGLNEHRSRSEYADLIFLVFDACRRDGFTYDDLLKACWDKLAVNKAREWGPRTADMPVEHVRNDTEGRR